MQHAIMRWLAILMLLSVTTSALAAPVPSESEPPTLSRRLRYDPSLPDPARRLDYSSRDTSDRDDAVGVCVADCRTSYIRCTGEDEVSACNSQWTQCQTGCR